MVIKRNINGIETEINLTPEEVREAYYEQEDLYYAEDICERYIVPDDRIDEAVNKFRKAIASNDCFWETYWMTVEYVCKDMGFEEKEEY